MAQKTPVWLISTKDIISLFPESDKEFTKSIDNNYKILFNREDFTAISLDNIERSTQTLTLKDFYSDYLNGKDKKIMNEHGANFENRNDKTIDDIITELETFNGKNNLTFKYIYRYKHCDENIFITRCYPLKIDFDFQNNPFGNVKLEKYWIEAYLNTVSIIMEKPVKELEVFCILHKDDLNGLYFQNVKIALPSSKENIINIRGFSYSHEFNKDRIYTDIIRNTSFFNGFEKKQEMFMLGCLKIQFLEI